MQTSGTLHFLSLKDKQSVSIQHGRKSQGTNSKMLFCKKKKNQKTKTYAYIQYIVFVYIYIVNIINNFCFSINKF